MRLSLNGLFHRANAHLSTRACVTVSLSLVVMSLCMVIFLSGCVCVLVSHGPLSLQRGLELANEDLCHIKTHQHRA